MFSGVKVFSTTVAKKRQMMGEEITCWLENNPTLEIIDKVVAQSSDAEYHCLSIILFFK